jgi:hypothetical protein
MGLAGFRAAMSAKGQRRRSFIKLSEQPEAVLVEPVEDPERATGKHRCPVCGLRFYGGEDALACCDALRK